MSAIRRDLEKQCPCPEPHWPKCPHTYHLIFKHRSARYSISLKKHLSAAGDPRAAQAQILSVAEVVGSTVRAEILSAGEYSAPRPPARPTTTTGTAPGDRHGLTFAGLVALSKRPNDLPRLNKLARVDVPDVGVLGDVPLATLTDDPIVAAFNATTDGGANGTKRKYRGVLRRFFRWAVAQKHLPASPLIDETRLVCGKQAMRMERVLPDLEAKLITAAQGGRDYSAQRLADLIVAALETACRRGELLAMRWHDVRWAKQRIHIPALEAGGKKTGKPRFVPLTARLVAVLRARQTSPTGEPWGASDFVFGDEIGGRIWSVKKAWQTVLLVAHKRTPGWTSKAQLDAKSRAALAALNGGKGIWWTDLRHEAALRWHEEGLTLNAIAKLLGHANLDMLQIYLGIDADDALDAHARLFDTGTPSATPPAATVATSSSPRNGSKTAVNAKVVSFARRQKVG